MNIISILKNKTPLLISLVLGLIMTLSACKGVPPSEGEADRAATYVAQTIQAMNQQETLSAFQTLAYEATQAALVTPTATYTMTPLPSPTPTVTDIPPTLTPSPTITPTQLRCHWVQFVKDVSIPDSTLIESGAAFTKTWRLKNIGSCTWTTDYDLVFVSGQSLNAPARVGLSQTVRPGETIEVSILMEAPTFPGSYTGYWMLADSNGNRFGVGPDADDSFWVNIKVAEADKMVYDFSAAYCNAIWRSGTTSPLPCPGDESDHATGFVVKKDHPIRESGGVENEPGLVTSPDNADEGYIYGVFPDFTVQKGDLFKAVIGCEYDSPGCNVIFELRYQINGGPMKTLASWHEVYEKQERSVTVDLSSLAGYEVNFVLYVKNNGTATNNRALWLLPRIMR